MADAEMKVFDWDDEISDDGSGEALESVILPAGNYDFEVIKTEKGFYQPGPKSSLPPCNMVKAFLRVDGGELGKSLVVENLYLCERTEWKISAFLRSIGLKKQGEPVSVRQLLHCDGEKGRCSVIVDTFTGQDGQERKNNKLGRFFDPDPEAEAPKPAKKWSKGAF